MTTLRYGDTGSLVSALQWRLGMTWNARFDSPTLAKVKAFQGAQHLSVDGVVGPMTWSTLPHGYPGCAGVSPTPFTGWVDSDDQYANIRTGPGFGYGVVGRYGAHAGVTGTLVGNGPWVKTTRGYVNRGTETTLTSNPSSINGKIPTSQLCAVPMAWNASHSFAPGYTKNTQRYLNCDALAGLTSLENAFRTQFGYWATIDLTYRSYAEQVYWYNTLGYPRAALPGTSNHGYGVALDFEEDDAPDTFSWGYPGNVWLQQNAGTFGFNNPFANGTDGESYHHNFVG